MLMKNYRLKRQSNILIWTFEHTRGSFAITLFLDVVFNINLVYIFTNSVEFWGRKQIRSEFLI